MSLSAALACEATETTTGGATTVAITCSDAKNAECKHDGKFDLFDDRAADSSALNRRRGT